jgi:putative transposase
VEVVANVFAGEHGNFVREAVAIVARELMEAEVSAEAGAGRGGVSIERLTHRNGYRARGWKTRVGEIELAIPRKRSGAAYFPSFLERRRRSEQAIVAVVLEAVGVSGEVGGVNRPRRVRTREARAAAKPPSP